MELQLRIPSIGRCHRPGRRAGSRRGADLRHKLHGGNVNSSFGVYGRERERERLLDILSGQAWRGDTRRGGPAREGAVLVEGPPGIGKTRLLWDCVNALDRSDVTV